MTRSSVIRSCFVAVILVGTTTLGACTTGDHQLPTLSGSPSSQQSSLEVVAKSFYDCMTDAGIEVKLYPNSDGELAFVQIEEGHTILQRNKGVSQGFGFDDTTQAVQMLEDFSSNPSPDPALFIDGVDHSEVYAQCLATSGYDDQVAQGTGSQIDPAYIELQVRSNNKWATCARENGWPSVKDSVMPTKPNAYDWPAILLPFTITEDQLRQLLAACPNFDIEQMEKMDDWWASNPTGTEYPDGYFPDPSIAFEDPPAGTDQATLDHIPGLYAILSEQANEYYDNLQPR